jgi:hypothetical protein
MTHNSEVNPPIQPQTEAEWEEDVLNETLKDVVDDDGNLDFDKLRMNGVDLILEDFYKDSDEGSNSTFTDV